MKGVVRQGTDRHGAARHHGGAAGEVRIIGGAWKRRLLKFPATEGLRPTPDRVRETVFNWLGQDLSGLRCLDLFAGSGAFGFEAASRGAERVLMLDTSPPAVAALQANVGLLEAQAQVEVRRMDALQFAASSTERFDIVFIDPPYRMGLLEKLTPYLARLTSSGAWLYVEAEHAVQTLDEGWRLRRSGKAGQVFYQILEQGGHDA